MAAPKGGNASTQTADPKMQKGKTKGKKTTKGGGAKQPRGS